MILRDICGQQPYKVSRVSIIKSVPEKPKPTYRKILSVLFFGLGAGLIIGARVKGFHLTEGEQLVCFFGDYLLAVVFLFFGLVT